MIAFDHPLALALCLAPVAAAVAGARGRNRSRLVVLPLDVWGGAISAEAPAPWRAARAASALLFALAWMALSVAAAGPASVAESAGRANAGADVVFVLDASPSMAARDLEPTRLEAAKAFVLSWLGSPEGASGAAVGLVAFGAEAALACPPTVDYAVVAERLALIRPGILGDGTAIGQGLASAYRQVKASGAARALVVLLSDGEDNVGLVHPADAARAVAASGAALLVVGLGSRGDVPIDYVDPDSGQRMSGAYRSGFDDAALAAVAAAGGGEYRSAGDAKSLEALATTLGDSVSGLAPSERSEDGGRVSAPGPADSSRRPLGRALVLAAMALAAVGWALRALALGGLA